MQWCSTCDQKPFAQQVQLLPSSSVKRKQECLARSRQIADALTETRTRPTLSRGAQVMGDSEQHASCLRAVISDNAVFREPRRDSTFHQFRETDMSLPIPNWA
jgi:hypothetical protein